jgi:hypothetical protein
MDEFIIDIARESGPTVVVVLIFIVYLWKRDAVLKDITNRCHETQDHATEAFKTSIEKNTLVIGGVTEVLRKYNGMREIK